MRRRVVCQTAQRQFVMRVVFRSVLVACLLVPLVAQSADPSAQTGESAKKTPPFPRKGTDPETSMREQHEYRQWMHDNNENVSTILVKLKPEIDGSPRKLISRAKAHEIGGAAGIKLEPERLTVPDGWQVLKLPKQMSEKAVHEDICIKLKQHPYVLECTPNGAIFPLSVPTDPLYGQQWSFKTGPGSANIEKAWDATTGAASTVIAVLDSGIATHVDLLASRILPGYDFVFNSVVANDTDSGRDAIPSDPGNWVTAAESSGNGVLHNCLVTNSNWHGTHVMGTIGATANNPTGVAGINWAAKLLPVRVLGKCGNPTNGPDDLTAALLWAAGVDIGTPGVNPNPAKVINMSLGGIGACPPNVQDAINQATAKGAVVIAAAGNDNRSASYWPATCTNVLTVMATNEVGDRWKVSNAAGSNWGANGVSAPGTNILSTVNPGTTVPVAGSGYQAYTGTSMAAAQVSGIASLMLAVKSSLTPFEVREIIKASAKKFASGSAIILGSCGSGSCGSGIVNAAEAVKQAKAGKASLAINSYSAPYASLISTLQNGQVVGWGRNDQGQLGLNPASTLSPTVVPGLTQVDRVFAAQSTTWAVLSTGEAYALGLGTFCSRQWEEQIECGASYPQHYFSFFGGDPLASATATPVRAPVFDSAEQVVVSHPGGYLTGVFVLNTSGQVLAWGDDMDPYNPLGIGASGQNFVVRTVQTPTVIGGLPPMRRITAKDWYGLGLDQSGNVWGWGCGAGDCNNRYSCNVFGNGAPNTSPTPMRLAFLSSVSDLKTDEIGSATYTNMVLKQDGTVWQWGCDNAGSWQTPVQVNLDRVVAINLYAWKGYAIRDDGSLWRWDWGIPSSVSQLLGGGVLGFVNGKLARTADGHLVDLSTLVTSTQSPIFGQQTFGTTSYVGRLNAGESSLDETNLSVSIASSSANVQSGQSFNYLLSVQNSGPDAATNAGVSVALPTGVNVASVPNGCTFQGQIVTCALGILGPGQNSAFSITAEAVAPSTLAATAYAYSDSYDYASSDDTAGVDVTIESPVLASVDGDVPTLPEWGVILMGSLLLANMGWMQRRKYRG